MKSLFNKIAESQAGSLLERDFIIGVFLGTLLSFKNNCSAEHLWTIVSVNVSPVIVLFCLIVESLSILNQLIEAA